MVKKGSTLGGVVRKLRDGRGWTLREMSDHVGIPLSTLSKIEHNRLTLTYDKLQALSANLNIRMSDLFTDADAILEASPLTARRSIGMLENSLSIRTSNYNYYYFCAELRRKRMIPVLTTIRAKSIKEFGELIRHAGEEFIFVLKGQVVVHTEFYDPVSLEQGQSIYIDSNMGHAYLSGYNCDEAIALSVMSCADDDFMTSLTTLHDKQ